MDLNQDNLLEKIYEIIKQKSKELKLNEIIIPELAEQNKNKILDKLEENYSIKISEYSKEFYKQGFIDGVKLIIECWKK